MKEVRQAKVFPFSACLVPGLPKGPRRSDHEDHSTTCKEPADIASPFCFRNGNYGSGSMWVLGPVR